MSAESGLETEKKIQVLRCLNRDARRVLATERRIVEALRFEVWRWLKVLHEGEAEDAPVGRDHMLALGRWNSLGKEQPGDQGWRC